MKKVFMWVDRNNFKSFARGNEFTAWSNESTVDRIQISVPPSAINTMEEKAEGIVFKCCKEENWL